MSMVRHDFTLNSFWITGLFCAPGVIGKSRPMSHTYTLLGSDTCPSPLSGEHRHTLPGLHYTTVLLLYVMSLNIKMREQTGVSGKKISIRLQKLTCSVRPLNAFTTSISRWKVKGWTLTLLFDFIITSIQFIRCFCHYI